MSFTADIILPVYYEEENIEKVLQGIRKHVKIKHKTFLIFQDKKDPTILIARKLQKKYANIEICLTKEVGIVKAIKHGLQKSKADIVIIMMSDLSDNPKDIDKMIKKIKGGYDFVCASRYMKHGKRHGGPKFKGLLSYLSCISLRIFTGINTHDATNAFKCFRRSFIEKITIESQKGYEMPLELIVKANAMGMKIGEVPTVWRERKKGKSKFSLLNDVPYYLKWYLYAFAHPKGSLKP